MARKRERLELADGQRLFTERLRTLLGQRPRPRNPSLDVLTGATEEAPDQTETAALDGARRLREGRARSKGRGGRSYVARTVYLQREDLEDMEALALEWSKLAQRRVSRSEVLRQALRWLRGSTGTPWSGSGENHAGDY